MTPDARISQDWTDLVRSALKQHYKSYPNLTVEKIWKSHHADFAYVILTKGQNRRDISRWPRTSRLYPPIGY